MVGSAFVGLVASVAFAQEPDFEQMVRDESLADMAMNVQLATVNMSFLHGEDHRCSNPGIFISPDGLALFSIAAIGHHDAPDAVAVAGGKKIAAGELLAVFPEESVALMKFDHEPEAWTTVAEDLPARGQLLALVPRERHCERCPMIWPVIAPVNSIWCRNSRELKEPVFEKLFNMVSGMSSSQQNSFANGTGFAVVNDRGELMGICLTVSTQMNVKHIESSSVAGLGKKIAEAVRNPIRRKLPLTADDCPVDLALADDDYRNWIKLESDGNHDEARECMLKVISRYPASALVLANALISPCYKEGDFTEADLPVVAQGDSDPVRHSKHQIRSRYWMQMLEREKAIEELEKAVEASPPDAIQVRMSLAAQYADDEEWEKAEKICRDMHRQSWGSIAFVEFFESVLTHLRKWEEVDACAERIIELGEMGRLQRGGGERELRERHETLRRIHGADDPVTVEADKHLTEFLRVKARMANPDDHGKNDP